MGFIRKSIALVGLSPVQKALLKRLAYAYVSPFEKMVDNLLADEDYSRANMMSPALGLEALRRQVAREKEYIDEMNRLIGECTIAGIAEWRIKLAAPRYRP